MKRKVLVIGDSHCLVWNYIKHNNLLPGYTFTVKHVNGATSQGINNPNSKTNALPIFQRVIQNNHNKDYIMISLGEVDCGFALWYNSEKYNIPINEQLNKSLESYVIFLETVVKKFFKNKQIILLGSTLPTIEDQTDKRFLKGARSSITASLVDRTALTFLYNRKLNEIARQYGLNFIDISNQTYDKNSKSVKKEFLHDDEFDHHLDPSKSAILWVDNFKKLISKQNDIN